MHKEFEIIDNKVIVTDDYNIKKERELTDNIKEILVCENNIEEIENFIKTEEESIEITKRNMKLNNTLKVFCSFVYAVTTILFLLTGNIFSGVCNFLCCIIWGCNAYFLSIRPSLKKIRKSEKSITLLQKELSEEKENLKELNKNKESNCVFISNEISGISTSEKISKLRYTLFVILDYEKNKRAYKKAYKNGTLNKFRFYFSDENLELIKELIKNDYPDIIPKEEKTNQKTKKLNY